MSERISVQEKNDYYNDLQEAAYQNHQRALERKRKKAALEAAGEKDIVKKIIAALDGPDPSSAMVLITRAKSDGIRENISGVDIIDINNAITRVNATYKGIFIRPIDFWVLSK